MYTEIVDNISAVSSKDWDLLTDNHNPFLTHAFLSGLERTGCVCESTGWVPQHVLVYSDSSRCNLIGAAPMYLKYHSYGEYVFDWAWANAYHRTGLDYYPKLLVAIPFTPVTGPRLLTTGSGADRKPVFDALIETACQHALSLDVSSLHWLFTDDESIHALRGREFMIRIGNQFHWHNNNYKDFDQFLTAFNARNRKKTKRERRRVSEAGIRMEKLSGNGLTPQHWDLMYRVYRSTAMNHGAYTYLNRDFFDWLASEMAQQVVLILARQGTRYVAGALNFKGNNTLFGRYWGALESFDGLHFETCYHSAIEYCIDNDLQRFEAGAQGEHKMSRGLIPTKTHSLHWLSNPRFANAVAESLDRETREMHRYTQVLCNHSPYRRESQ
jgi:predicted N-acyltransferase